MIKILGAIILILSGIYIGWLTAERYKRRALFLRQFYEFISEVKTEIRFCSSPLHEILKSVKCGGLLNCYISKCIKLIETENFASSWRHSFCNCSKESGILKEEEQIIINFGIKLGESDKLSQIAHCDYNMSILEPGLNAAEEIKRTKLKLPIILGASLAFVVVLIFI